MMTQDFQLTTIIFADVVSFHEHRTVPTISCLYEMVVSVGTVMLSIKETKPVMNGNRTHKAGWYAKVHK